MVCQRTACNLIILFNLDIWYLTLIVQSWGPMKWCLTPTTLITGVVFLKSKPVEVHTQIFESLRMNILCCMFSSFKCKNVVDKTFRYYSDRQNRKCKSREVSCIEYLLCKETVLLTCSSVCFISIIKSAPYNNCQYYSGCEALEL